MDLGEIREEIDGVDKQIVQLFQHRMDLVNQVAEYKIENHKQVLDRTREHDKIMELTGMAHSRFNARGIQDLFKQIMAISRKHQYRLLTDAGQVEDFGFEAITEVKRRDVKVVYQGVEGAYTHEAAKQFFGEDCDCFHVLTWSDAMEAVKTGKADYAILPIENSSAGMVNDVYDLMVSYDNVIVAETYLRVKHCLIGTPGTSLDTIQTVYSHQQGLAQCSDFLDEHRDWDKIPLLNTAIAARKVAEDKNVTEAAIASETAAKLNGLEVIKKPVNNVKNNTTRFIIVSGKHLYTKDAERVSICFEAPHESGSLYQMLSHIIYNGLNMTKIESRPIPEKNWEYRFFVDFEGNLSDPGVISAINGISHEAIAMKILGNY